MSDEIHNAYDLSNVLGFDCASMVEPGSSILVSGPSMTGKEALMHDLLADGLRADEGAIAVTTGGTAEDAIADLTSRTTQVERTHVGAIDCRANGNREERLLDQDGYVYSVSEPSDFTGIGVGITKCLDRFDAKGIDRSRLALTSLSTMVTYADRQTVFKFCHVLSSRLDSADFLGLFLIDSNVHDEQTMAVLTQAFDGLLEVRERDGRREARLRGLQPEPTDWRHL